MKNVIRLATYAGVGLVDKVREEIDELVKRGELKKQEGELLVETFSVETTNRERGRLREVQDRVEALVKKSVHEQLHDLEARLERLEVSERAGRENLEVAGS